MFKDAFAVGLRVWFARSSDKATKLFGRIVRVHDGAADCVDIETEPDGKRVEVSTIETAHAADVVLAPEKKIEPSGADLIFGIPVTVVDAAAAEETAKRAMAPAASE